MGDEPGPVAVGAVALGGNAGRPLAAFRRALAALAAEGFALTALSAAYLTRAAIPACHAPSPAAAPYWNAVVRLVAEGSPWRLLAACQRIEAAAGRVRRRPFDPRPLDLDVLVWGDVVLSHRRLCLPHPRLGARPFVLWPLCEVAPDLPLPGGVSPRRLLAALDEPLRGIAVVRRDWASGDLAYR